MTRPPSVGVIGAAEPTDRQFQCAIEVGRLVAERGGVVVCGGLGGVMDAVCRGAAAAGGVSIGLLPGECHSAACSYVTYVLPTGMGQARNVLIVLAADCLIAIGGGYGTLSEIAHAVKLGRTVITLDSWQLTDPDPRIISADTPREAVDMAWAAVAAMRTPPGGAEP